MTQKELLYVEDAIEHEKNIISICTDMSSKLTDENLKTFINNEISIHNKVQNELMNLLKEEKNGQ